MSSQEPRPTLLCLPNELLRGIAELLNVLQQSVKSFSLSCRRCRAVSLTLLFRRLTITSSELIAKYLDAAKDRPYLSSHVESMSLCPTYCTDLPLDLIFADFSLWPVFQKCTLLHVHRDDHRVHEALYTLGHIMYIASHCVALEHIALSGFITVDDRQIEPGAVAAPCPWPIERVPATLKTLTLHGASVSSRYSLSSGTSQGQLFQTVSSWVETLQVHTTDFHPIIMIPGTPWPQLRKFIWTHDLGASGSLYKK